MLPAKLDTFIYKNNEYFKINRDNYKKNIFNDNYDSYSFSNKIFENGNLFSHNGEPKKNIIF